MGAQARTLVHLLPHAGLGATAILRGGNGLRRLAAHLSAPEVARLRRSERAVDGEAARDAASCTIVGAFNAG